MEFGVSRPRQVVVRREQTMITMKLTGEEAAILHNIVKTYIEDLRVEIMHTDRREYRDMLKQQEVLVRKILEELEAKSTKVAV